MWFPSVTLHVTNSSRFKHTVKRPLLLSYEQKHVIKMVEIKYIVSHANPRMLFSHFSSYFIFLFKLNIYVFILFRILFYLERHEFTTNCLDNNLTAFVYISSYPHYCKEVPKKCKDENEDPNTFDCGEFWI